MSKLGDIRAGLVQNLETATALAPLAGNGYLQSNPVLPVFEIFPDPEQGVEYHKAMANGLTFWRMIVRGTAGTSVTQEAQAIVDAWLDLTGDSSVFQALESDKTLGGACGDLVVRSCSGHQEYIRPDAGGSVYAASWIVDITI